MNHTLCLPGELFQSYLTWRKLQGPAKGIGETMSPGWPGSSLGSPQKSKEPGPWISG